MDISNSDITIRQFRADDLPQVVEMFLTGMRSYEAFRAMTEPSEAYLQACVKSDLSDIEDMYITLGGNFWVATPKTDPTKVVGIVGLEAKGNKEGELRRLSVKDTHRRFGVGRMLIATLEHWARENGFQKIWLTTGGDMDKARAFYLAVGFKKTAVTVLNADPYVEAFTFEKPLDSLVTPLGANVDRDNNSGL
ncbi:hypothetical protein PC129_g19893 [Phytophthora cactorum]|uniref:N-acetyltransferase domain-containing protein n=1 Tax=Phytophthora cactorum TaxID=29920 RepID=A0A329SDD2_9STRA|nr:hypothetical protein Pcac1_g16392 [Phytophthora cactorum]KAG2813582.1 hypothetical protein PC111_g14321 [Phytophthora cactorum]KAG2828456.1 hypothetical protein PC112_g8460 [Phytophthora cactorum]KAG2855041.1 hypothetical protein PC113_g12792 [Phytophthora cactorum]KAG2898258.1 hypothetical protein PC117_g22605 [Phytophthora cactorum]